MQVIDPTINRPAELETLCAELAEAHWRLAHTDNEGKRIVKQQIREIQRNIRRNSAILGANI